MSTIHISNYNCIVAINRELQESIKDERDEVNNEKK